MADKVNNKSDFDFRWNRLPYLELIVLHAFKWRKHCDASFKYRHWITPYALFLMGDIFVDIRRESFEFEKLGLCFADPSVIWNHQNTSLLRAQLTHRYEHLVANFNCQSFRKNTSLHYWNLNQRWAIFSTSLRKIFGGHIFPWSLRKPIYALAFIDSNSVVKSYRFQILIVYRWTKSETTYLLCGVSKAPLLCYFSQKNEPIS